LLRLRLLICRVVHRSPIAAVSYNITYRDGGGETRCIRRRRGIAIEDNVGDFKGKLFTYLELEAMPSAGRRYRLLLLLLRQRLLL